MSMAETATVEVQMPQMGESVTEGTVLEWHKKEGEFVDEGETVVEVSTDKVDAEVPAPAAGTVAEILKSEDDTVHVGETLARINPNGEPSGEGGSDGASADERQGATERQAGPGLSPGGTGEGDADLGEEPGDGEASTGDRREAPARDEAGVDGQLEAQQGETIQITMPEMGESVS